MASQASLLLQKQLKGSVAMTQILSLLLCSYWFADRREGFRVDFPRCFNWPPIGFRSLQKPRRRVLRRFSRWKQHIRMECYDNWTSRYSLVSAYNIHLLFPNKYRYDFLLFSWNFIFPLTCRVMIIWLDIWIKWRGFGFRKIIHKITLP